MIKMDSLLVKCPQCGAWPMAANLPRDASRQQEIHFTCTRCRHEQGAPLRSAATIRPASERSRESGAYR